MYMVMERSIENGIQYGVHIYIPHESYKLVVTRTVALHLVIRLFHPVVGSHVHEALMNSNTNSTWKYYFTNK